jgi:hypothetical protein
MNYPPKSVTCKCGNQLTVDRRRVWCTKCGQPVYYHEKDQRWHRINALYIYVIFVSVILLVAYFFIEMIAKPFLNH